MARPFIVRRRTVYSAGWQLQACIFDAERVIGIRHRMYNEAVLFSALCYSHQEAFQYNGGHLDIKLFFGSSVLASQFQGRLQELNSGEEIICFQNRVRSVEVHEAVVNAYALVRVAREHYQPGNTSSPTTNRNQMACRPATVTTASAVLDGSPLFSCQSIEKRLNLLSAGIEKAHIKNKACCNSFEKLDQNNLLALSPWMHSAFDGGGFRGGRQIGMAPTMIIQGCQKGTGSFEDIENNTRHPVYLFIKCDLIYIGAALDTIGDAIGGVYKCLVWVVDVDAFITYLQWKHEKVVSPEQPPFYELLRDNHFTAADVWATRL